MAVTNVITTVSTRPLSYVLCCICSQGFTSIFMVEVVFPQQIIKMINTRYTGTKVKVKGKVHTRIGHKHPEQEHRYSSTALLTSMPDGGGRRQKYKHSKTCIQGSFFW